MAQSLVLKFPLNIKGKILRKNVNIQFTQEEGFSIVIRGNAKNILVQPYKIYFCAEPIDGHSGLEPLEADDEALKTYRQYFYEATNNFPSSCWLIR